MTNRLFPTDNKTHFKCLNYLFRKKGIIVCDFGCGLSGSFNQISKHSESVIGLDADAHLLRKAQRMRLKNVAFVCGDCLHPPLQNQKFDVVICTNVLEHLIRPEQGIASIYDLLKTDGCCLIEVPCLIEVIGTTFGNPLMQIGRALIHRNLDIIHYRGKASWMAKLLFKQTSDGKLYLRSFMPKEYQAEKIKKKVKLDTYVTNWLQGNSIGFAHKHWLMPKEWIELLKASKLFLVSHQGIFYLRVLAKKKEKSLQRFVIA